MATEARAARPAIPTRRLTVVRKVLLGTSTVRITFGVEEFDHPGYADSYVKLLFDEHGPLQEVPDERPTLRTYTVRHFDEQAGEVTVDFVVHGAQGLAGPWAARCEPGDTVLARGPRGKWSPLPEADFHLFVGDEAALPAIEAGLEQLASDARGLVVVETRHDTRPLPTPEHVDVEWLNRGDEPYDEERLARCVDALPWDAFGAVSVFAHGERGAMKALRKVFKAHDVAPERLSISGYWAYGRIEDQFQAEKKTEIGKI
ncbi:MAG: siderophore-interacting protein [Propionibacteriaceae bacterium]|nr:siderophore-interacting protein [Propionibacteriaceae bacterium]